MNQRGFTLIEIAIVTSIAVVLATMAIPNYLQWVANQNLKQSVAELKGDLQIARMIAMKTGNRVGVEFNKPQNGRYLLFLDTITKDNKRDDAEQVIDRSGQQVADVNDVTNHSRELKTGITFSAVQSVVFGKLGKRVSPGGAVVSLALQNDYNTTRTLTITPIGDIL